MRPHLAGIPGGLRATCCPERSRVGDGDELAERRGELSERVVERLEGTLRRDGEDDRLLAGGVPDLYRRAVVERAPVERHLDSTADPECELAAGLNRLAQLRFH